MADEPFYSPKAQPPPPRVLRAGELLFEFLGGHDRFRCELRDHGVEAQFYKRGISLLLPIRFD